jgi:hypothetical protein
MMGTDSLLHHLAGLDSTSLAPPKFGLGSTDTRQAESLRLLTLSAREVKGIVYVLVKLCDYNCCSYCESHCSFWSNLFLLCFSSSQFFSPSLSF